MAIYPKLVNESEMNNRNVAIWGILINEDSGWKKWTFARKTQRVKAYKSSSICDFRSFEIHSTLNTEYEIPRREDPASVQIVN